MAEAMNGQRPPMPDMAGANMRGEARHDARSQHGRNEAITRNRRCTNGTAGRTQRRAT